MTAILDTCFLVATVNSKDKNHQRVINISRHFTEELVLPITVLPEVTYLITSRLGHYKMRQFLDQEVGINKKDLKRVTEILNQYSDSKLDFVDATIVAIAEKMNITKILTLDRRDFGIIKPLPVLFLKYYLENHLSLSTQ